MSKAYEIRLSKHKNDDFESVQITSPKDIYDYAKKFYKDDLGIYESMFIILLNRANNVIGWSKIAQGGTCKVLCDIKIISKIAIDSLAESVALVHNHPSGNIEPSNPDKSLNSRVKQALQLFDITLIDSIIITEDSYYSFADSGIL